MRKREHRRFTAEQPGVPVSQVCRRHGVVCRTHLISLGMDELKLNDIGWETLLVQQRADKSSNGRCISHVGAAVSLVHPMQGVATCLIPL